jgi:uncharacterized protein YhfF
MTPAQTPSDWQALPRFALGDSPALAGHKTPTCRDARENARNVAPGVLMVALDGRGEPRAMLETMALNEAQSDRLDAGCAFAGGEADRSSAQWRTDHQACYSRNGHFAPDMLLYRERFRLVTML